MKEFNIGDEVVISNNPYCVHWYVGQGYVPSYMSNEIGTIIDIRGEKAYETHFGTNYLVDCTVGTFWISPECLVTN